MPLSTLVLFIFLSIWASPLGTCLAGLFSRRKSKVCRSWTTCPWVFWIFKQLEDEELLRYCQRLGENRVTFLGGFLEFGALLSLDEQQYLARSNRGKEEADPISRQGGHAWPGRSGKLRFRLCEKAHFLFLHASGYSGCWFMRVAQAPTLKHAGEAPTPQAHPMQQAFCPATNNSL